MSCIRLRGVWKLFCVVMLLLSMFAHAQQPRRALNNEDIIKMTHDGFDENVIVALVESNPTAFDVSIDGLTSLKTAGVSGKVMEAMLKMASVVSAVPLATSNSPAAPSNRTPFRSTTRPTAPGVS